LRRSSKVRRGFEHLWNPGADTPVSDPRIALAKCGRCGAYMEWDRIERRLACWNCGWPYERF